MSKKIIVAGAGHGGISAAALIAQAGFDVTVYERSKEGTLGYDWTDIFAPGALEIAGIEMPPEDKYSYKENMTFYSPDMNNGLRQHVAIDQLEIKMERRDIYSHLISHAEAFGVKFVYDCDIKAPILFGDRVVGIKTSQGDFYAELVIDAAGIDSPLRTQLPAACGIENTDGELSRFYVYRAFYNRIEAEVEDKYKIYMLPQGNTGVGWVAAEDEYTDVLIGRFHELSDGDIEESLEYFRKDNRCLGTTLCRGGQRVCIPVRQPLSVLVCDGYAAIGDSAFMTVPIIGSGIANSLKAARILADTVIADKSFAFNAETLWPYQVNFYHQLGSGLACLALVKILMTQLKPEELDYMFATGILTADDLTIGADSTSITSIITASPSELLVKARSLYGNKELLSKVLSVGVKIGKVTAATAVMPKRWDKDAVTRWSRQYLSCFSLR